MYVFFGCFFGINEEREVSVNERSWEIIPLCVVRTLWAAPEANSIVGEKEWIFYPSSSAFVIFYDWSVEFQKELLESTT